MKIPTAIFLYNKMDISNVYTPEQNLAPLFFYHHVCDIPHQAHPSIPVAAIILTIMSIHF